MSAHTTQGLTYKTGTTLPSTAGFFTSPQEFRGLIGCREGRGQVSMRTFSTARGSRGHSFLKLSLLSLKSLWKCLKSSWFLTCCVGELKDCLMIEDGNYKNRSFCVIRWVFFLLSGSGTPKTSRNHHFCPVILHQRGWLKDGN